MRFRKLELIRYGGFADRVFDFGERQDGRPDLHLVIGPNEAGKSTALQAIGDLLFGIRAQTTQNWRHDYSQLGIRAHIEHDGGVLDVTRRKGNRDTLLQADGTPFREDPLTPLLGGVDRAVFESMFGLDHAKLRSGGESIVHNRDDAARITLEAGTGVAHIGRELARLQDLAASLFKPGGQNPAVNKLMRERSDALAEVRHSIIGESEWTQVRQRRADAGERRQVLIAEAEKLEREQARVDRLSRARAPLARLMQASSEREGLGDIPDLPSDAAERLTSARVERATADELVRKGRAGLARVEELLVTTPPAGMVLSHRAAIEALEERRPVVSQAAIDLERRRAELGRIEARMSAARIEAHLPEGAALPSAGWRRRVALHLEALRTLAVRDEGFSKQRAKLTRERAKAEQTLSALATNADPAPLQAAIAKLPSDAIERHTKAKLESERKTSQAERSVAALTPWRGAPAALAGLDLPSEAEAAMTRREIDAARGQIDGALKDATAAEAVVARETTALYRLTTGSVLPTPEVVQTARGSRDTILADVRKRLSGERQSDDEEVGNALAEGVQSADELADRRDAEAARIAEHQLATVALHEAQRLQAAAKGREAEHRAQLARLEESWAKRLELIGFERVLIPIDWAGWLARRETALASLVERDEAIRTLANETARLKASRAEIAEALQAAGGDDVGSEDNRLLDLAQALAASLADAAGRQARLTDEIAGIDKAMADLADEEQAFARGRAELEAERAVLTREAGMQDCANAAMLTDALEALLQITDDVTEREGLVRQIDGMERDRHAFVEQLGRFLKPMGGMPDPDPADQVRTLAAELDQAIRSEEALTRHAAEKARLELELQEAESRMGTAQTAIAELMALAGVKVECELDQVLTSAARLAILRAAEDQALADLAGLDNGMGLPTLQGEVAALTLEAEAAARSTLEERRRELAAEREEVGRALAAAEVEAERAAIGSGAADAQQRAAEATAALAQSAEEHIEAAAAAALLRWVVDRHRANNQAPLVARASGLFAQVTAQAFTGLRIGYGLDDRPVMLAVRSDGSEVGVEALSEGTRDQLYLALRLASIGSHAAGSNLPIICDDLLITADDERAGELLRALAMAAALNQVIVFSHHDHLLGVADGALGSKTARVHRIPRERAAA